MIDKVNGFKAALAAVIAALTALWGWFGWLVLAWVFCMTVDYLTGYFAAMKNGEWNSAVAREGIWHKGGCVVMVLIAGMMDGVIGYLLGNIPAITLPFTYTVFLCPLVLAWYILMELGSMTENVGKMGAPVPPWLRRAIAILKDTVDEAGNKIAPEETERKDE